MSTFALTLANSSPAATTSEIAPMLLAGVVGAAIAGTVVWLACRSMMHRQIARSTEAERRAAGSERLAQLGTMTSGLAHEIKNPLSTIGLNAQLLSEDLEECGLPDDELKRLQRRIETLRREVDRLKGILEDFLKFAGRVHLDPSPHDLNVVVDEMIDFFTPQAERAGVRLRAMPAATPVIVSVDASLLKQALLNLLLNATDALKSFDSNGQPKELMLRVVEEAGTDEVSIHVIDTGPGIKAESVAQIFHPYFSTKSGGTGLGLPTSRRIVEEHGGRLAVHSEPGRGTEFVISLPTGSVNESSPSA